MEEFKRDKEQLENNIAKLLGEFANKHKVRIDDISFKDWPGDLSKICGGPYEQDQKFNVYVRVVL